MKHQYFTALQELEQADTAWKKGVLLGTRTEDFHTVWLYQLNEEYIEVTYHTHFNVLLNVSSFTDTDRLEPYLETIDVSGLLA